MVDGDGRSFGTEPRRGFMLLFPMRTADPPQSHAILLHPPCPWACCLLPAACNIFPGTNSQHHPQGSRLWGLLQQLTQHLAIHAYRIGIQHAGHIGLRCFLLSLTTQGIA